MFDRLSSNPYLSFTTKSLVCIGACLALHKGIGYFNKKMRRQTKWYVVHTVGNAAIVALALKGALKTTLDPLNSLNDIDNFHALSTLASWPITIMSSIHLYHIMLYYKEMTKIDWIHHLVSGGVVGSICTFYIRGSMVNHGLFFLCGLPGGIDYALLSLNDMGMVSRMTEKRINRYLNMYIRLPGILFNVYSGYISYLYNDLSYNPFLGTLVLALNSWNAIYFAQRVVENYGKNLVAVRPSPTATIELNQPTTLQVLCSSSFKEFPVTPTPDKTITRKQSELLIEASKDDNLS